MLYKDYIKVESDFIPVFSSSSDRIHPEKWKSFYPHESFKKILTLTIETLEKGTSLKDRPIWINGSYGTGKTFASFVIKHILEDGLGEVESYFTRNGMNSLWRRVAGVRGKGKILVVHHSSSAGINSQNKLFNTIIEAVKRTLREKGYVYTGAAAILDRVSATLKDPNAAFNFRAAFNKYRGKFLSYTSPAGVIADLETLDGQERLELLEDIVDVAEQESYNWSMSAQDVIAWLRDVRTKNGLYAIVFIWDEFTEYFRNNLNNITGLQELAQNAAELSFYLFLITHGDANQLVTDIVQRKIIEARFKSARITLAEHTAFELMAQALTVEPASKKAWQKCARELWESVRSDGADFILQRDDKINLVALKKLLPIHPYAACLLKFIAQSISSNQRTMFQFLCSAGEGSFRNFIDEHGFEYGGDNFLTTDFLWDYFFQEDNPDLDERFQEAMGHYGNFVNACKNENQRRILKTTLTLLTLQQKSYGVRGGVNELWRATQKNICACFAGTPLASEVRSTLSYFVDRGIISPLEEGDDTEYILATAQIDPERMKNVMELVCREKSFDALIKDESYGVTKKFLPTDYLKYRLDIQTISPTKFLQAGMANVRLSDNQILMFYLFAVDETEQGKVNQVLRKIREKFPERCLVADFSGTPFTKQRYDKFVQNKARELYFRDMPNQAGQVRFAKKAATALIDEWINQLGISTVRVWSSVKDSTQVTGEGNFFKLLRELNKKFFGAGLEEISINDRLFSPSGFTETVAKYALSGERIKGSASWLNLLAESFDELSGHGGERYWLAMPSHPISKMKLVVDDVIAGGLARQNETDFNDIWHALKKPPFGLLKCAGAVFLFALLMKDYADKNFYVRDVNSNTHTLTRERLCNLILHTVKELPAARDKFIVKQTPEHKEFCRITTDIFNLPEGKVNSVEDAAKNICIRLIKSRYPLWTLRYFVEENYFAAPHKNICLRFLQLIEEFVNPQTGRDATKVADDIFLIYEKYPFVVEELKDIVREENFRKGMTGYVAQYKPELQKIVGRLKLLDSEYLSRLNEKLSEDSAYLWKVDDVNRQIDNLCDELRLIEAINGILSTPQKELPEAFEVLEDKCNSIKIPYAVVEEFQPELKNLLQTFAILRGKGEKNFGQAAEQINRSAPLFKNFFENQFSLFYKALTKYVDGAIEQTLVERLFTAAPTGNFFKPRDDFVLQMKALLQRLRRKEKTDKFFATWQEITGTASPADWSVRHGMPILCAFQNCLEDAQSYFAVLNKTSALPNEAALDSALKFLRSDKLSRLNNKRSCEKAFVHYFCGEDYAAVIGVDELRDILRRRLGNDVYSWFSKKDNCKGRIVFLADRSYREKFLPVVRETVRKLSAEEAKKYLEELIEKDTLLGIRILKNS